MLHIARLTLFIIFFCCSCIRTYAQESEDAILYRQGTRYIDGHIHALDKYNTRIQKQQQRLLAKLGKQESSFAARLKKTDSAGFASYSRQQPSFDSISKLARPDSTTLAAHVSRRSNKAIDSLKGIQSFVQSKAGALPIGGSANGVAQLSNYDAPLKDLNNKLNYKDYINSLISQRSSQLKRFSAGSNLASLTGMDKQIAYAKSKMQVWKQVAEEPSAAEEKALEYLQGTEGFDQAMFKTSIGGGVSMKGATSAEDLEKLGFQTKKQVNDLLKSTYGSDLSALQQQMGSQVADWQKKTTGITDKVTAAKAGIADAKQTAANAKQQASSLGHSPLGGAGGGLKGIPFWKRFEKQYSFQTTQATGDGTPALLQLSAGVGYKQTKRLTLGAALAANAGLGQSWSSIRFSLEGVGLRSFATYEMIYGIGAYAGYERMFKQVSLNTSTNEVSSVPSPHNTGNYSESILLGLSKDYRINSKYNGAIQLLYDVWWKDKGLRSPLVLRFVTKTK